MFADPALMLVKLSGVGGSVRCWAAALCCDASNAASVCTFCSSSAVLLDVSFRT